MNKICLKPLFTTQENQLFSTLLLFLKKMELNITIRVAGGWPRDKLLNVASNDLDITVCQGSGLEFAKKFAEFLNNSKIDKAYTHKLYVIKENPSKSKHLETASFDAFGLSLDFCALRNETYNDTRIPIIDKGTALEDAFRRDFTINSIFYNINDSKFEDLTEKGFEDLNNGIIRTPLCPKQTFLDDPLRILRGFRLIAKLNFTLQNDIIKYIKEENIIKEALRDKVSKERVRIEFEKSIKEKYNFKFFEALKEMNYLFIIYGDDIILKYKNICYNNVDDIVIYLKNNNDNLDLDYKFIVVLSYLCNNININDISDIIVKHNLKFPNKYVNAVDKILKAKVNLEQIIKIEDDINNKLGTWLKFIGELWVIPVLLMKKNCLIEYIKTNNYHEFYLEKPLLNGLEIVDLLKIEKKKISQVQEIMINFQLKNKKATKEDFINYYLNNYK